MGVLRLVEALRLGARLRPRGGDGGSAGSRREDGGTGAYTIAESAVALALLLTVLVPAAGALTYLVTQQRTQHRTQALVVARVGMERALASNPIACDEAASEPYSSGSKSSESESVDSERSPWRTACRVERRDGLVLITVAVHRRGNDEAITTLRTARLDDLLADGEAGQGRGEP